MSSPKILCAVDFSPHSELALAMSVKLARRLDADLLISHCWYLPPAVFAELPFPVSEIQRMTADEESGLAEQQRRALALGAPRVETRLTTGVPWSRIVELARDEPAVDLVVVGTHGRGALGRVLLGSVSEKVVRHAPCSVLVVRGPEREGFRDVLVPVDFSTSSHEAMMSAARLVEADGAITLLHVVEVPVPYSGEHWPAGFLEQLDARSAHLLEQWATELRGKTGARVIPRTRLGAAGAQALAVLDQEPGFDLVVVGSHGRTGLSRALLGSVAEKLVRHAGRTVLVTRSR